MGSKIDNYDDFASEYAEFVAAWEKRGIEQHPTVPILLDVIGDVSGLRVLDAGCGEGYFARILAGLGATVTGIDISPRLIQLAQARDVEGSIAYRVANLSQPLPEYRHNFDLIASNLVLNDVSDYQGFSATLTTLVKPGGRVVLSLNNPYSFVIRGQVTNYFDSGKTYPYRGLSEEGIKVHFYQRTLEEYLDAFLATGFQLRRLVDIPTPEGSFKRRSDMLIPVGYQFPFFMVLSFVQGKENVR